MDVGMITPNGNFSLRAAALIIQNNRLLAIKHDNYNCFYTIGGGIGINETSADAVMREAFEETGRQFLAERLVFIQERFYTTDRTRHHEVVFFYLMKPTDVNIESGTCTDHLEEKLQWLPIDTLQNIQLVPDFLRTALINIPDEITHIITVE